MYFQLHHLGYFQLHHLGYLLVTFIMRCDQFSFNDYSSIIRSLKNEAARMALKNDDRTSANGASTFFHTRIHRTVIFQAAYN